MSAPLTSAEAERRIAEIARGLTKAQREAVMGRFGWDSPWAQESGEAELERLGIWNPRKLRWTQVLTPLGLAVRAHLKTQESNR